MSLKETHDGEIQMHEKAPTNNLESPAPRTSYNGVTFTEQDGKTARRRVDLFLVSTLTLYYFCSYLDRSNLGSCFVLSLADFTSWLGFNDRKRQSRRYRSRSRHGRL